MDCSRRRSGTRVSSSAASKLLATNAVTSSCGMYPISSVAVDRDAGATAIRDASTAVAEEGVGVTAVAEEGVGVTAVKDEGVVRSVGAGKAVVCQK